MTDDFALDFGLGGLPSPFDAADLELPLDTASPLPADWLIGSDTPISMPPHINQGATPMCGGYSSGQLKRYQEKVDKHGVLDFDYAWVYRHSRQRAGLGPSTEGTTARAVLATLLHEGIPIRGDEASAPRFRIKSYASIRYRTDDIRRALMQYAGPVLIGMRWPANWHTRSTWHPPRASPRSPWARRAATSRCSSAGARSAAACSSSCGTRGARSGQAAETCGSGRTTCCRCSTTRGRRSTHEPRHRHALVMGARLGCAKACQRSCCIDTARTPYARTQRSWGRRQSSTCSGACQYDFQASTQHLFCRNDERVKEV
jgi:hypothetical protein